MLFVEVESVEKRCKVIIDLEKVIEIAPLVTGGCALFFDRDPTIDPARLAMNVKNEYSEFQQFVVQTVSSDDIAKRIESLTGKTENISFAETIEEVVKKKAGRPSLIK